MIKVRQNLQDSLLLVHGGMAQDVGPILEMVTEKYLLRTEWLSPGRFVGLRLILMIRDLRFTWEEMSQQLIDEQA